MKKKLTLFLIINILTLQLAPLITFAEDGQLCQFKRWLRPGLYGDDVRCLQKFLEEEGFFKYPEGPTGYYGKITQESVRQWQKANNITPSLGYFGPKSFNKYIQIVISKQKKHQETTTTARVTTTETTTPTVKATTTETTTTVSDITDLYTSKIINIPEISDNDLIISENGLRSLIDYLDNYFNKLNLNLDTNKLDEFLKEITTTSQPEDSLFVPHLLIEEAINNPQADLDKINKKIDFLLEFYKEKIKEVRKINISPALKEFHKKVYITDLLTIQLMETYKKYLERSFDKKDLLKYLDEYKDFVNNVEAEMIKFLPSTSHLKLYTNPLLTYFLKFLEIFSKPAKAQLDFYPFGGRIIVVTPCKCPIPGFLFYITPPKPPPPPLGLFASLAFLASPFFYMWKQLRPPVWVLGNAWLTPVPCGLIGLFGVCGIYGSGLPVYMMGTSLF